MFDIDLIHQKEQDLSKAYWYDHYTDAYDIDHFSGHRVPYHNSDDDEDFNLDMHYFESPRTHMPEELKHDSPKF